MVQSSKIAKSIAETLEESITKKGDATFVVSGGNSPLEIFHCLSNMPIRWSMIKIILGDDRLLDSSNIDSNEKLIAENLMINKARKASYISLTDPKTSPSDLTYPFDVVLLGMGLDGHFASLFPELVANKNLFNINSTQSFYTSDIPLGKPSHRRVTMPLSMLLNTKRCILLVSTDAKRLVLDQAKKDNSLPLYYLLNQTKLNVEFSDINF
ncbi:6-phosphogluconolactonase [Gammaproteobacteria bacterium]|jgi:6-phosphogluconolactonase|nr:6-phosphogluconolactonase [Gammaproteobacteria bacterium]|tara:strand:+ start:1089 stop:1721 length:633 start_codon:yes stop_codon:yes gene_type:complete